MARPTKDTTRVTLTVDEVALCVRALAALTFAHPDWLPACHRLALKLGDPDAAQFFAHRAHPEGTHVPDPDPNH